MTLKVIAAVLSVLFVSSMLFTAVTALRFILAEPQPRCDDKAPKLSKPVDRMRA